MFLDWVIGGRGIAIEHPTTSLVKNIILKPIEMSIFGNYVSLLL
jgi:hypothetical protein